MLRVLPFVEDPDLSVNGVRAFAQHLPPCYGINLCHGFILCYGVSFCYCVKGRVRKKKMGPEYFDLVYDFHIVVEQPPKPRYLATAWGSSRPRNLSQISTLMELKTLILIWYTDIKLY